ncbi:PP2C family protein-serine/threonine phosphatase [Granulicella sibirica]|uniref:Serine phosphatase RsbU, regulator of sigma subunit n=1 Tax=Granulicella sibirica TaxID=2479048 RepID=A0A4Q0SZW0_9BACT|nr:SpoIIE family protein phosphatase [Granulicella sibirica]RXH55188.1 Serine phosphatase RsbU, regulator of sigma subunit [Granulicella sibirica]
MPTQALLQLRPKAFTAFLLACAAALFCVLPISAASDLPSESAKPALLVVQGIGKASAPLDGQWQFHLGDNPAWASPTLDDTAGRDGWEQIAVDKPWGSQGHFAYYGYAWYRLRIDVTPVPGAAPDFSLLLRNVTDVYEVYWNGVAVGHLGSFPPHLDGGSTFNVRIFDMGPVRSGVLAVRVWRSPPASNEAGLTGGFEQPPLVGSHDALTAARDAGGYRFLAAQRVRDALIWLYGLAGFLSMIGWIRDRSQRTLLWIAIYTAMLVIESAVGSLTTPLPIVWLMFFVQIVIQLREASQWFVLLWLLQLVDVPRLSRTLRVAAAITIIAGSLDGFLFFLYPNILTGRQFQMADAFFTSIIVPLEVIPVFLVGLALVRRQQLDSARWFVAICALLNAVSYGISNATAQGARYTHWTIAARLSTVGLTIFGAWFPFLLVLRILLFVSIIYAAVRYSLENSRRQAVLEREFQSAREIQQILVPEALPTVPGFSLTSAYKPAQEVGGDFFQVIPLSDQSTVIVLGDVSGKGLKAAMTVSLIVGAIRTLVEINTSPAEILAGLNRRLYGRLQGGFTTCIALHINPQGVCTLSSAGHPSPILNRNEVDLPGALPLGLDLATTYEEVELRLREGDHLALYTDGLLEARNAEGELYGFERLNLLFGESPTASRASDEAVAFGQDDDITVLTLTRLLPGDQATTLMSPDLVLA